MIVSEDVEAYSEAHTTAPPDHLQALFDETHATLDSPQMLTGVVEGRFLETLVWVARPRLIVELGTYSGYSAQFMAQALEPGGRLINCYHQQMPATSRSPDRWRRAPGLRTFAMTPRSGHRGSIVVGSTLYAAFANNITRIDATGVLSPVAVGHGPSESPWLCR